MRTDYAYRVIVERWPDWCPDGWQRVYRADEEDIPEQVLAAIEAGAPIPTHRRWEHVGPFGSDQETADIEVVILPRLDRKKWLSGSTARRWARIATALGAEVRLERGRIDWEAWE